MIRAFYAHSRKDNPDAEASILLDLLVAEGAKATVTTGRDDFKERFRACGNWSRWAQTVGQGTLYDGRPRYTLIVCPTDREVGRATAQIVGAALEAGKDVVYWVDKATGPRPFRRVLAVDTVDPENWKTGWALRW